MTIRAEVFKWRNHVRIEHGDAILSFIVFFFIFFTKIDINNSSKIIPINIKLLISFPI